MPRIVVLMGCYNEEQHLTETIPAVLGQTMADFRLFILDNGSTDNSGQILRWFAVEDQRLTILTSPRNLPPPDAMNLGVHAAMQFWPECRWFVTAGADDLMDPDYLASILAAADAYPDVNCIYSCMRFIDHPEKGVWRYPQYDPSRVHEKLFVPGWRAFTREMWESVGPENTDIGPGSDWEWICRASVKGALRPYQLPEPKLSLRIRDGRTRVSQSYTADRPALLKHMSGMVAQRKREEAMAKVVWGSHAG